MLSDLHRTLDLFAYWWHRLTTSRYVLHLENEVRRLKDENAGLRDTVFGLRGLPPMARTVTEQAAAAPIVGRATVNQNVPVKPVTRGVAADAARKAREAAMLAEKELQRTARSTLVDLQNQLNEEIKREQEARSGAVVTHPGAEPVVVSEPIVEDEADGVRDE